MLHMNSLNSFVRRSLFRNNSCALGNTYRGLLHSSTSSKVTVLECIFLENKASHTFGAYSATLTVINCTGDILSASSSWDGIINTNKKKTESFNLTLSLLSLGKCEAEFPFSFDLILFGSKKKKKLVYEDLLSFNFSLECLINITCS